MYFRLCFVACLALASAACSLPMAAITSNGHIFRGTLIGGIPNRFEISDGRVTCSGVISRDTSVMQCNHGLKGIVLFKHDSALTAGVLRLSDGTEGTFVAGDEATRL